MIVMSVALDNLYGFKDFSVNFSYPKKLVRSTLAHEHLSDRPTFKYKKIVVVMGGNATGKTTFGKALMGIFNFITRKDVSALTEQICDKSKPAYFCLEFVVKEKTLWRVDTNVLAADERGQYKASNFISSVKQTPIGKRDTYERCKTRLDEQETEHGSFIELFDTIEPFGWYFTFPDDGATTVRTLNENPEVFEQILDVVFRTLDPSIKHVHKSKEMENAYIIKHASFDVMIQDGKLHDGSQALSTGTLNGIDIALLLSAIMSHQYGWYYCDEKYSFIQSDIEQTLFALMMDHLGQDEQFFFTTHNSDVLDMNLPHHSFLFLQKEADCIYPIFASEHLKRNTDNLRSAMINDVFSIKPNMELLSELDNLSNEVNGT